MVCTVCLYILIYFYIMLLQMFTSAAVIVEERAVTYRNPPSLQLLTRTANRVRQRRRPRHPDTLDFEVIRSFEKKVPLYENKIDYRVFMSFKDCLFVCLHDILALRVACILLMSLFLSAQQQLRPWRVPEGRHIGRRRQTLDIRHRRHADIVGTSKIMVCD